MRKGAARVLAVACIALVAVQTMGLHVHLDSAGNGQGLHGAHPHHDDHGEHDPDRDLDGSKLELGNAWSKSVVVPITAPLVFIILLAVRASSWPNLTTPVVVGSPWRWRPPLRAPPSIA